MYCTVQVMGFIQQLYFITYNLQISASGYQDKEVDNQRGEVYFLDIFLKYLPIMPVIIETNSQRGLITVALVLLIMQVIFFTFIGWQVHANYTKHSQKNSIEVGDDDTQSTSIIQLRQGNHDNERDEQSKKSKKSGWMLKASYKACSFYLIVHDELLFIPTLISALVPLTCQQTVQTLGLQCFGGLHSFLIVCSILQLSLLLITKLLYIFYMNDSYPGQSSLPFTQFHLTPVFLNRLITIFYCLWYVFDYEKRLPVIAGAVCFTGMSLALGMRYYKNMFSSDQVRYTTLTLEVLKWWISLIMLTHQLLQASMAPITLVLSVIIACCLVIGYQAIVDKKSIEILLQSHQEILLKESTFEMYLSKLNSIQNSQNSLLQGIILRHTQSCEDQQCPCNSSSLQFQEGQTYNQEGIPDLLNEQDEQQQQPDNIQEDHESNPFAQRKLQNMNKIFKIKSSGGLLNITLKAKLKLIAEAFMSKFELIRCSTFIKKIETRKEDYLEQANLEEEEGNTFIWDKVIKYWIGNRLDNHELPISPKLRYLIAQFYYEKVQNQFQALFELMLAEHSNSLPLNLRFQLFRLRKRLESSIMSKYENYEDKYSITNEQVNNFQQRISILKVYEFETGFSMMLENIASNTQNCQRFWGILLEKNIEVEKLHDYGIKISERHQEITVIANKLLQIIPRNLAMLLTYSRYLRDIVNNEFYAIDIFSLAQNLKINLRSPQTKQAGDTDANYEQLLFGENSFTSVFILRTDFKNLGLIEFANHEVHQMFGYRPETLIGKDISIIMPEIIGSVHKDLMMRFFDKAESSVINKYRELFVKDKDGYLVPVILYPKVLPNLSNGLKFIGALKRIQQLNFAPQVTGEFSKMNQEYLISDKDNYIQYFSSGLTIDLGIFPRMFFKNSHNQFSAKEIKLDDLSYDFINKEIEIQQEGCYINLTTKNLENKIERENLTPDEYNYYQSKVSDFKVFCQMTLLEYSRLASVKLFRIIVIQRSKTMIQNMRHHSSNMLLNAFSLQNQSLFISQQQQLLQANQQKDNHQSFQDFNMNSSIGGSQHSASSLQNATDRNLRDLKMNITENKEPKQIKVMKRVNWFLILFLIIASSLAFMFHIQEAEEHSVKMLNSLQAYRLNQQFVKLQMNMRTLLNVVNGYEETLNNYTNMPYNNENRIQHVINQSNILVEDIRMLNNLHFNDGQQSLQVEEIDKQGYIFSYEVQPKIAINQYVAKTQELLFEATTNLSNLITFAPYSYPESQNKPVNMSASLQHVSKSAFYLMSTGFRVILDSLKDRQLQMQDELFHYQSTTRIQYLDIFAVVAIILAHIMLAAVIQMIEENKVRVLTLYSEIKIADAREQVSKCQKYHNYLMKHGQEQISYEARTFLVSSNLIHDENDNEEDYFKAQWESLQYRLDLYKQDEPQRAIKQLQQHLKDPNQRKIKFADPLVISSQSLSTPAIALKLRVGKTLHPQQQQQSQFKSKQSQPMQGKAKSIMQNHFDPHLININQIEEEIKELDEEQELSSSPQFLHKKDSIQLQDQLVEDQEPKNKDQKIGKHEQFLQIQHKNWKLFLLLFVISIILTTYFAVSFVYNRILNQEIKESAQHIEVGMTRDKSINLLFASLRERLVYNDTNSQRFFSEIEAQALQEFYQNEDKIQRLLGNKQSEHFQYDLISKFDSKEFCDLLSLPNCLTFHKGVLEQGYKQSLFSFIKYYTQLNFTIESTTHSQTTFATEFLNNKDLQAFLISSETYYFEASNILAQQWLEHIDSRQVWEESIFKANYSLFMIVFFIIEVFVIPKIIKGLKETTWRSRGILNLVPSSVFSEIKNNAKIMMIFSN